MAIWQQTRVNRVFAFLVLAAITGLTLAPVLAGAHHHENDTAFAEVGGSSPALPTVESDCSLCAHLSVNDGRSLGASASSLVAFAVTLCALASLLVFAPFGTSSRALSIRAPPVNA